VARLSPSEHAEERFQAIQHAYDQLLHRTDEEEERPGGRWHTRTRGGDADAAGAAAAPAPPTTPEEQQQRWRGQLGGLQQRAATRERRDAESKYRQAMRAHATRGSFSSGASSDAGHERLQGQLGQLLRPARDALPTHAATDASRAEHLLAAEATGVPHGDRPRPVAEQMPLTAAETAAAEAAAVAAAAAATAAAAAAASSPQSASDLRRILRLARVAKAWRVVTGYAESDRDAWDGE
jgi:hypothetical protein